MSRQHMPLFEQNHLEMKENVVGGKGNATVNDANTSGCRKRKRFMGKKKSINGHLKLGLTPTSSGTGRKHVNHVNRRGEVNVGRAFTCWDITRYIRPCELNRQSRDGWMKFEPHTDIFEGVILSSKMREERGGL